MKESILTGLMLALALAILIFYALHQIGEGKARPGPLGANASREWLVERMKYHGANIVYECDKGYGWCFKRDGKECVLW